MKNEKNQKIELTPQQSNPYLCRPEDWAVDSSIPGSGQRGDSQREFQQLLAKRKAQGKGVALGTKFDEAAPVRTGTRQ
jgi:hypothetical protein